MRSYIIPMDDIEEHTHDDPIRQHEHNVYHGHATWFPSSSPSYNYNDSYELFLNEVTSNAYNHICFVQSISFIVLYFTIHML